MLSFLNGYSKSQQWRMMSRYSNYSQGLKNRIRVEIERSELTSLSEAMRIADRMDSLYSRGSFFFQGGPSNGPTPMEIGQVPFKKHYKFVKLSDEEKEKLMKENKCLNVRKKGVVPIDMGEKDQKLNDPSI